MKTETKVITTSHIGNFDAADWNWLHISMDKSRPMGKTNPLRNRDHHVQRSLYTESALSPNNFLQVFFLRVFDDQARQIFIKAFGLSSMSALSILKNRLGLVMHRKMKQEVLQLPIKYIIQLK